MNQNSAIANRLNQHWLYNARSVLARKGKSFYWATCLFERKMASDVAILYAFCRFVDDIADTEMPETARSKLLSIRKDLDAKTSMVPEVCAFIDLSRRIDLNLQLPRLLVDAVIKDTQPVRIASPDELIRYAYGVAATVGLMMCVIMGVRNAAAHPFAIDLGIAMQLTNIARDVVEDAGRDRRYLPGDWLGIDLLPSELLSGAPGIRRRVIGAQKQLLDRAAIYYRSADRGMRFIPFRARLAILTAARLYEAIGDRILSPSINWGNRAYVNSSRKTRIMIGALGSILFNPAYGRFGRHPAHDAALHLPLLGLPGAHGEA